MTRLRINFELIKCKYFVGLFVGYATKNINEMSNESFHEFFSIFF